MKHSRKYIKRIAQDNVPQNRTIGDKHLKSFGFPN